MGVMKAFQEGGFFMYFILAFGVVTVGLIVERTISLYVKVKSVPQGFRQKVLEYVGRGDFQGAETFSMSAAGETSLGRVAEIGCHLRANAGGEEEIQARMDEALTEEISRIDRKTGFLAMFGNVATLLGLLGTITGMIHSFAAVANASPVDRATMLSKGISEAMNCTAFGLIVAIPALVAYAIFQNRTDRMVSALTEEATQIFHDLLFLTESSKSAEAGKAAQASRYAGRGTSYRAPEANA